MHSIDIADTGMTDIGWAVVEARRAVGEAVDALADARRELHTLTADTQWQSASFRALNDLLDELRHRSADEVAELHRRQAELAAVEVS